MLLARLQSAPKLAKRDIWLTFLPFLLWVALIQLRPSLLKTHCATQPCQPQSVISIDQPGLGIENGPADGYSFMAQNFSGVFALATPIAWGAVGVALGNLTLPAALLSTGTDLVIFTQTAGWNGLLTEAVRQIAQRPRPFVYGDPIRAQDPQNYVSFYSGHTSFAAAAWTCLLLILLSRGAKSALLILVALTGECFVITTAVFRILSGRHFLTDVLAAAVMGTLTALAVASWHRPARPDTKHVKR